MSDQGDRIEELESAIESLLYQFAYDNERGELYTGGLSALEEGFRALGWPDPKPLDSIYLCDEPGCLNRSSCGVPTPEGYRRLCESHYRELVTGEN